MTEPMTDLQKTPPATTSGTTPNPRSLTWGEARRDPTVQRRLLLTWECWATIAAGSFITLACWFLMTIQTEQLAENRFRDRVRDLTSSLISRFDGYEQALRSGVAMIDATEGPVSRAAWETFVNRLDIVRNLPGIQGIGFARRVDGSELIAHELAIQDEGFSGYRVRPTGERPEYFPIVYLEPFASRNLRAFGYDMYSEPIRNEAMRRARVTGMTAATGKVRLVQETDADIQAGFLIYLPVYSKTRLLTNPMERFTALRGYVYSPFRMNDLMDAIMIAGAFEDLDIQIFDGRHRRVEDQLYGKEDVPEARLDDLRTIDLFGRPWTVRIAATGIFDQSTDNSPARLVLVAGAIITLLALAILRAILIQGARSAALTQSHAALTRARMEAEEANTAKSRFLAAASHDLRQPLQTLGIYLHMLSEQPLSEQAQKLVAAARDGYDSTQRLLNSLMDISSMDTGLLQPQIREIDVAGLLSRIGNDMRAEAATKGLDLRIECAPAQATTDPAMLERIIRNLLNNAVKYTSRGAVRLKCISANNHIIIKVQDTGPGIPKDRIPLIFEDFYQIDNPDRDRSKGLGLGLSTVNRLSRLLGYQVRVLSRMGRGSVFTLDVPPPNAGRQKRPRIAGHLKQIAS